VGGSWKFLIGYKLKFHKNNSLGETRDHETMIIQPSDPRRKNARMRYSWLYKQQHAFQLWAAEKEKRLPKILKYPWLTFLSHLVLPGEELHNQRRAIHPSKSSMPFTMQPSLQHQSSNILSQPNNSVSLPATPPTESGTPTQRKCWNCRHDRKGVS